MVVLPFCPVTTYLGVKLDRAIAYRRHLMALRKKLSTRVSLQRRLAGSGRAAGAKTLRTAALSLIYSTAECCEPVWYLSAHTRLIDNVPNDALHCQWIPTSNSNGQPSSSLRHSAS